MFYSEYLGKQEKNISEIKKNDNNSKKYSKKTRLNAAIFQLYLGVFGLLGVGRFYLGMYRLGIIELVISLILILSGFKELNWIIVIFDFLLILLDIRMKDENGKTILLFHEQCEKSRFVAFLIQITPPFFGMGWFYLGYFLYPLFSYSIMVLMVYLGSIKCILAYWIIDSLCILLNWKLKDVNGNRIPLFWASTSKEIKKLDCKDDLETYNSLSKEIDIDKKIW